MVKRILLVVVLSCVMHGIIAQGSTFKPEWNIGVGFGPTFSSMSIVPSNTTETIDNKSIQRLEGGVSARYISEKNLGIIAELNYSQQGWEEKFEKGVDSKYVHQLNYLELPVLTHIYFGDNIRYYLNLGPKISYLLSEKEEMRNVPQNGSAGDNGTLDNQYGREADHKIDYGIIAGLGLELRTKVGSFALEGRYSFGLGDIFSSSKNDPFSRSANRVISARLTYYMKLF